VEQWELLRSHSRSKSYSKAVAAALSLALAPKAGCPADWNPSGDRFAAPGPLPAREVLGFPSTETRQGGKHGTAKDGTAKE
jgi:hypothetical protein